MRTFKLALLTLLVIAIVSQSARSTNYDPNYDANHDGRIDILDLTTIAAKYGTQGNPSDYPKPIYESPWILAWGSSITLYHNLSTYRLSVQIFVNVTYNNGWTREQYVIGRWSNDDEPKWRLPTNNTIEVYHGVQMQNIESINVKVLLWKIPE